MQGLGVGARFSVAPITTAANFPKVGAAAKAQAKKTSQNFDERRYACSRKHLGSLAASIIVSFARQIGHAPTENWKQPRMYAPCGELPRPSVAGEGRAEIFSPCRKSPQNVGRSLQLADEWSDNDHNGHYRAVVSPSRHRFSKRVDGAFRGISKLFPKAE